MNTIVIDCGASFIKAAKFQDGVLCRQLQIQAPSSSDFMIRQPRQIDCLMAHIRDILKELTDGEREVALGISNEMHGFILTYKDGTPLTDYISWQKEYGSIRLESLGGISALEILEERLTASQLHSTGMPLRAGLPSCNLLYLKRIGILEQAVEPLTFYTLGDYILRQLSGKKPMIHPTNAAASGMYDLELNNWSGDITSLCGGNKLTFLPVGVEQLDFCFGTTEIHAFPAIGDQQAALLGAGLDDEETISYNVGTGAQVSMLTSVRRWENNIQIRPYFKGKYLRTIPHIPSGRALNVYIRFIRDILSHFHVTADEKTVWENILAMERESVETGIQCDMSFFENAVTAHKKGSILQIGEFDLTGGNLFHAIFRSMADNFLCCAEKLNGPDTKISRILFSGGVGRKVERIRENILSHYPSDIPFIIAENETLTGIDRYLRMLFG